MEVPVYDLDRLPPGGTLKGQAIVDSGTTTVITREGDQVIVTPNGWLDIQLR